MPLFLLGGCTGSGKTEVLQALKRSQHQVLDLEGLCNHSGSVFGHLPHRQQKSSFQFHKALQQSWSRLDLQQPVFAECKPPIIGDFRMPSWLTKQMADAPVFWLELPREVRLRQLIKVYGTANVHDFTAALFRLKRQLSEENLLRIQAAYEQGDVVNAFGRLLDYFDDAPLYNRAAWPNVIADIRAGEFGADTIAGELATLASTHLPAGLRSTAPRD